MAEHRFEIRNYNAEQCRQMLSSLPGIFAAGLRFDEEQLVEIHILASNERNPKQIARDVQSALFAAYGLEVDHRIISIAQLPNCPFYSQESAPAEELPEISLPEECAGSEKSVRLLFNGIDINLKDGVYRVTVHLSHNGEIYSGEAHCRDTNIQRNRTVAQATLEAVHSYLGRDPFNLLEVKQINVLGITVDICVMEYVNGPGEPLVLIGAAVQPDNAAVGIVRSTLDGLNRNIGRIS